MMPEIADFTLKDMVDVSAALRSMGSGAASMEEAADRIVHYLYDHLTEKNGMGNACALVRLFKTHPYADLDDSLRTFASGIMKASPVSREMKCLVLLGSAGELPEWNSRHQSAGHKAIPLPSEHFIESFPMITQLIQQLGLEVNTLLQPDPSVVMDMAQKTYNVFLIPDATGSVYVPAQDGFVIPFNVRSVLGFGGILPSGNLFTVIIFSKVKLTRQTADMFRSLALSVKIAILPFDGREVFSSAHKHKKRCGEG
jgi:two-component system NtrC family sensor kinase